MISSNPVSSEVGFPKALFLSAGYFALLLPSLTFAWNAYMNFADPPVVNQNLDHAFLLSGFGGWLWFGAAFTLPAFVLLSFCYFSTQIWKAFRKDSYVVS